jgi:tRNA nucleotidyltransferase (CCA-adding enzyme)
MKFYLVGGAVRDRLMGRMVSDRDWVVVGGTPAVLLSEGYQAVGGGFPVFLHPVTREEYALARTERRTGPGHRGFETWFAADVTLEDDLRRRDLTINAIAMTPEGEYIDPFGGREDIRNRCLRAVSPAFAEDPLRVLRVARFAAQLPGFDVHPETLDLMRRMVSDQLLAELPAERVWHELDKAVHGPCPERFLEILADIAGFEPWFNEWKELELQVVRNASASDFHGEERLAIWCESLDAGQIRSLCARLKTPNDVRDFLLHVQLAAPVLRAFATTHNQKLLVVLERLHAFHSHSSGEAVFRFVERRMRTDLSVLRAAVEAACQISAADYPGLAGKELGAAIRQRRIEVIDSYRRR